VAEGNLAGLADPARPAPGSARLTLPNAITLARICAVPVAIWLVLRREWLAAALVFAAAGASDALDGWLARRGRASELGAVLDPIADKALVSGMTIVLAAVGELPAWLAILIVFRDLVIVGGVLVLRWSGQAAPIRPLALSKANTALQILLIALVLALDAAGLRAPALRQGMIVLVAASTLLSGLAYLRRAAWPT
jgi:cardiolipin synthase (CMP-forming)